MSTKIKQVEKFLDKGLTVKLVVMLIGRQLGHPERGVEFLKSLDLPGRPTEPVAKGRDITMIIHPERI
jgi:translation initiation factor IF-3